MSVARRLPSPGGSAASLVDRLQAVWPEAEPPLRVRRRPGRVAAGTEEYLVLPALTRPTLLIPAAVPQAASSISRVDEGQRHARVLRALASAQRGGLLRRLPMARVVVPRDLPGGIPQAMRDLVPETRSVVVRLGRRRHGRAVVVESLDAHGRSIAFGKAAWGEGRERIRREHANLTEVGTDGIPGVRAPTLFGLAERDGWSIVAIRSLVVDADGSGDGTVPLEAMRALAKWRGVTLISVAGAPITQRLREGIGALLDRESAGWLGRSFENLLTSFGETPLTVGTWHGDWTAWNMARDGATVLLWDWEGYDHGVPLGFDHLHFVAQSLRANRGTTPEVEDLWLAQTRRFLDRDWGVADSAAEATIRLYLLELNLRFVMDRQGDPLGAASRQGWARPLLERLEEATS